jgi:prepilin-type N-terminal cleavage/methylation domain-containing protein
VAGSILNDYLDVRQNSESRAFTLVELLVVIGIIALLAGISVPVYSSILQHAHCTACGVRMRNLGIAFSLYATDNNGQLPGRVEGTADKWPVLLLPYVTDPKAYVDPNDPVAKSVAPSDLVSNTANNSSFFFNGFNDLGFYNNPTGTVHLVNLANPPNLILLGQKIHGSTQYYMDFVEGNENDILNKTAYFGGSNYTFADGSMQFLLLSAYNDKMWLVNQNYQIPPPP